MHYSNNMSNNYYNHQPIEIFGEINNIATINMNEEIINNFLKKKNEYEEKLKKYSKNNINQDDDFYIKLYLNSTIQFLGKLNADTAMKRAVTNKFLKGTEIYSQSNNIEEKEVIKKGIQTTCFCCYLCNTQYLNNNSKIKILQVLSENDTKDLYNNFYILFKEINKKTKDLIKKAIKALNPINTKEIKKRILEDLYSFKKNSYNDDLEFMRILYNQNINLLSQITKKINVATINKIINNMYDTYEPYLDNRKNDFLEPQTIINMALLYTFLYLCNKNEDQNQVEKFLNEISKHEIEDIKNNIYKIICFHDKGNIIKTINEKITEIIPEDSNEIKNELKKEILTTIEDTKKKSKKNEKFDYIEKLKWINKGVIYYSRMFNLDIIKCLNQCQDPCINRIIENPSLETPITVGLELLYALLYSYKKNSTLYSNIEIGNFIEKLRKSGIQNFACNFNEIFKPHDKQGFMESIKNELTKNINQEELNPNYKENLEKNQYYLKNDINNIEKQNKNFKPNLRINYKNIKAVNQDEDLKIVENFKNKIWKKIPHTDINSLSDIKEIEETFDFYKGECIDIIFDSSLDEVTKEELTKKILDIKFPQDDELENSENKIMAFDKKNEEEKDYTKKMNIISLLLYIATKSKNEERNEKMLNFILKCDIEDLYKYIDEIFEDFEYETKEAIYKKYEITPQ